MCNVNEDRNESKTKQTPISIHPYIHPSIYPLIHPSIFVWHRSAGFCSDPKLFHKHTHSHSTGSVGGNEWILTDLRLRRQSMYWRRVGDAQRAANLFDLLALQLMSISVANIDPQRGRFGLIDRCRHHLGDNCWMFTNKTSDSNFFSLSLL